MNESASHEAPFSLNDLIEATTDDCTGFRINGESVEYRCVRCDATFPQTNDGHAAMRAHEFEHGRATRYQPEELDGKRLRVYCVRSIDKTFDREIPTYDTYGIDDAAGAVYHLSHQYNPEDYRKGGWKWKLMKPTQRNDGPKDTRGVLALLSNGYALTAEK